MANALTGDFPAAIRVNGRLVNKLLAAMHRNAFADASLPSLPHEATLDIGYPDPVDDVRGRADAQVSVPRVTLIDGATDRFQLEVWVRAHWRGAPGSAALRDFMVVHVTCQYQASEVGGHCYPVPRRGASPELWLTVLPDTVAVDVVGEDDGPPPATPVVTSDAELHDRVLALVTHLLTVDFAATPHRLSGPFDIGRMVSLDREGGSEVAIPVALDGSTPAGDVHSLAHVVSSGHDFAMSVSADAILGLVGAGLHSLSSLHETFSVTVGYWYFSETYDYDARVNSLNTSWQALPPSPAHPFGAAVIAVEVTGQATVDSDIAPDFTFDVTARVVLSYEPFSHRLLVTPGVLDVSTDGSGVIGEIAEGYVEDAIRSAVPPIVAAACANSQPQLDKLTKQTSVLTDQLTTIDAGASASLDNVRFEDAGLTLLGDVELTRLPPPQPSSTVDLAAGVHTAYESWIPGGRVDRFEWTWQSWTYLALHRGTGGSEDDTIRFTLDGLVGGYGPAGEPVYADRGLPGLATAGRVCLRISGVQTSSWTGELVPVTSDLACTQFGVDPFTNVGNLSVTLHAAEAKGTSPVGTMPVGGPAATPANVLALFLDAKGWPSRSTGDLVKVLATARRRDAGLALLVVAKAGVLDKDRKLASDLGKLDSVLPVPVLLVEDTDGGWARRCYVPEKSGGPQWRLISPGGGIVWAQDGIGKPEALRDALAAGLFPAPPVRPVSLDPGLVAGLRFPGSLSVFDGEIRGCPPPLLSVRGAGDVAVVFTQEYSTAAAAAIDALLLRPPPGGVVAVVDGAHRKDAERLRKEYGDRVAVLVDDGGAAAARAGVRLQPTTLVLTENGIVRHAVAGGLRRPVPETTRTPRSRRTRT